MVAETIIIIVLATLTYFVHHFITTVYSYWKNKGIKGPKPLPIFGNTKVLLEQKEHIFNFIDEIYKKYPEEKVIGMYLAMTPALIVRDPEIMKTVLIRDFQMFKDRGLRIGNKPISNSIFLAKGEEWKAIRQILTPTFTSGKLKSMMAVYNTCVEEFYQYIDERVSNKGPVELRSLMNKLNTKAVSSIFLGIDVDTFKEEVPEIQAKALGVFTQNKILSGLGFFLNNISSEFVNFIRLDSGPPHVTGYYLKLVKEIMKQRNNHTETKKDLMDLIISLKKQGSLKVKKDGGDDEIESTDEFLSAQVSSLVSPGFDAASGMTSYLFYELAKQPAILDRCCEEIDKVMATCDGKLDYDNLKQLEYTYRAFEETLRKYGGAVLLRECIKDYTFQDLNLTIKKGTKLLFPMLSLHNDPKYFPEPDKFDPDRFLPENKQKISDYYKPFGDGPRSCIAMRFAQVQTMLGIVLFLRKYRVSVCERTPEKIVFDPRTINLQSKDGIWLNIERRHRA